MLHRAGLDPHTPGRDLDEAIVLALWADAVRLLTIGRDAGWIVTDQSQLDAARDHLLRDEQVPRWRKVYAAYARAGRPCPRCGTLIRTEPLGRQRLFWCPGCQLRPSAEG